MQRDFELWEEAGVPEGERANSKFNEICKKKVLFLNFSIHNH